MALLRRLSIDLTPEYVQLQRVPSDWVYESGLYCNWDKTFVSKPLEQRDVIRGTVI